MGAQTAIAWCDRTMNFWIGCTKVSTGPHGACEHCYAEAMDIRFGHSAHWGPGAARRRTSPSNWSQAARWNAHAARTGLMRSVFSLSRGDFFDKEVPAEWRADAWKVIQDCPELRWIILSKRMGLAPDMLPPDWGDGWPHVGFVASVATQAEANRDVPKLLEIPAAWHGLSIEPQMGPIDLEQMPFDKTVDPRHRWSALTGQALLYGEGVDGHPDITVRMEKPIRGKLKWIIGGGESWQSTGRPREYNLAWARALLAQCRAAGVAYFQKQLGGNPVVSRAQWYNDPSIKADDVQDGPFVRLRLCDHRAGADPSEWPPDLKVQQWPEALL